MVAYFLNEVRCNEKINMHITMPANDFINNILPNRLQKQNR